MAKRPEARAAHFLEGLVYRLKEDWRAFVLIAGLAILAVAAFSWATRHHHLPATEEEAEVVRFGAYSSETGPIPVVIVRTHDGQVRQLKVHRSRTRQCEVGSTIHVVRRGDVLSVSPKGCALPPP